MGRWLKRKRPDVHTRRDVAGVSRCQRRLGLWLLSQMEIGCEHGHVKGLPWWSRMWVTSQGQARSVPRTGCDENISLRIDSGRDELSTHCQGSSGGWTKQNQQDLQSLHTRVVKQWGGKKKKVYELAHNFNKNIFPIACYSLKNQKIES